MKKKSYNNILVTGGAGFIGSHFIDHVLQQYPDSRIIILDSLTYAGSLSNIPKLNDPAYSERLEFCYGSILNTELVTALVREVDAIVHFAAETHVTRSLFSSREFFETDTIGTHNLVNAALINGKKLEHFIHISTSEVYGTAEHALMDEDHPLNPATPYASAKCGADRMVYSYWKSHGFPCTIVRPFNNYGPRQHLEKLIPRFICNVLVNEPLLIHGGGSASRDYIHASDTCKGIDALLQAPIEKVTGQAFNLATGTSYSIAEIASQILEIMERPNHPIQHIDDRPGQVDRHTGCSKKINELTGWKADTDWRAGLEATIDWFRNNQARWEKQLWMRHVKLYNPNGDNQTY